MPRHRNPVSSKAFQQANIHFSLAFDINSRHGARIILIKTVALPEYLYILKHADSPEIL